MNQIFNKYLELKVKKIYQYIIKFVKSIKKS